jgi:hypothetical protein
MILLMARKDGLWNVDDEEGALVAVDVAEGCTYRF